ncbi:hypothetical protein [Microbacterium lacticum]
MTGAASVDAEVAATLETLRPELARLARELYDEPEIGFAEHASAARLGGRLSLIGTPAEENGGGKELIIRAGGFDDVDAAGMVPSELGSRHHVGARPAHDRGAPRRGDLPRPRRARRGGAVARPERPRRGRHGVSGRRAAAPAHPPPPPPAVVPQGGPSTDMGNVSRIVPSIHPSIGLGGPDDVFPHNADFAGLTVLPPALDALVDAAAALAATAVDYVADPDLRAAAASEFEASGGPFRGES